MTNREWVEKVALQNYDRVLRVAYLRAVKYRLPNPDSWARDMTQAVFLRLNEQPKEKDLKSHENITAWLFATLFHIIGNDWQKRSSREIAIGNVETLRQAPVGRLVLDELFPAGMTEQERDLLYRCHCLQMPRQEVAVSLGITPSACQMRLERAEEKFRRLRQAESYTADQI